MIYEYTPLEEGEEQWAKLENTIIISMPLQW
jgi:hypothetical protein